MKKKLVKPIINQNEDKWIEAYSECGSGCGTGCGSGCGGSCGFAE